MWTKKGNEFNWKNPEELEGMRLGVLLGEGVPEQLKEAYRKGYLEVNETKTYEQNFKMLLAGRIDILAINKDTGNGIVKTFTMEDQEQLIVNPVPLRVSFYRVIFNKNDNKRSQYLLEKFNTGLHILRSQGKLQEMIDAAFRGEYDK